MGDKKITVTVVVNGTPTEVETNVKAALHSLVSKALEQSGSAGQSTDGWELRIGDLPADLSGKPEDYGLEDGATVFLNLKAGVGG